LSLAVGSATDDAALVQAAERICKCLPDGLARWFGPYGSLALVSRALAVAAEQHPSMASIEVASSPAPRLTGVASSARAHGAAATVDGVVTLIATLDELLGRLIGADMTLVLLEQCAIPSDTDKTARESEDLPHTMDEQ
jgi:hypothetical protein